MSEELPQVGDNLQVNLASRVKVERSNSEGDIISHGGRLRATKLTTRTISVIYVDGTVKDNVGDVWVLQDSFTEGLFSGRKTWRTFG